jgi:hypothetical protein
MDTFPNTQPPPSIKDRVKNNIPLNYNGFIKSEQFTQYLSIVVEELEKQGGDSQVYSMLAKSDGNDRISCIADMILQERQKQEVSDTELKRLAVHTVGNLISGMYAIMFDNYRNVSENMVDIFNKIYP